jgi:hypothetical protein
MARKNISHILFRNKSLGVYELPIFKPWQYITLRVANVTVSFFLLSLVLHIIMSSHIANAYLLLTTAAVVGIYFLNRRLNSIVAQNPVDVIDIDSDEYHLTRISNVYFVILGLVVFTVSFIALRVVY